MQHMWARAHSSVLSLTFRNAGERLSSGTAFKLGDYLITNNHVIQVPGSRRVSLRAVGADGFTTTMDLEFGHLEFSRMLVDGDPEAGWDYAVMRVERPEFAAVPPLEIGTTNDIAIGSRIVHLGYQFDQPNLSMHVGHISSQFRKVGVHYVQLDSSVNNGNSGGPPPAPDGRVTGTVQRQATGLSCQFDALRESFRTNIAQLEASQATGVMSIQGIDPVGTALVTQRQMDAVSREIGRSANVGIGFAYSIEKVRDSLANLSAQ